MGIENIGLIHLYYGDGKGKTTAGMGQIIRAAGYGMRILLFQFMKDNSSGERIVLEHIPNITIMQGQQNVKFSFQMNAVEKEEAELFYTEQLRTIKTTMNSFDVIFLDEIITAVRAGFIKKELLLAVIKEKPKAVELIMTGHMPDDDLFQYCDYITEMKKHKHPYDLGQKSRVGIES